jgi:spoIIIJ-associated protein
MESIEQTGRTVDEAVNAALKALGASREEVEVEVLSQESRGILGSILGYSSARVRVTRRAPPRPAERERQPAEPESQPVAPAEAGEHSELALRAAEIADQVVRLMGIEAHAVIADDGPEAVSLEIHGDDDLGLLIGKHGQTLAALQLIVAMMANRQLEPDQRQRVIIDAEGYRARRDRALQAMAQSAAQRATRSGRAVTIPSLTPRERRIIHLTLADDPSVTTSSEGEEPNRAVIITPRRREGHGR